MTNVTWLPAEAGSEAGGWPEDRQGERRWEGRHARRFLVARTRGSGIPFVVGECAEPLAGPAPGGLEVRTRQGMIADREMRIALSAWEAGDDRLLVRERARARRAVVGALAINARVAAAVADMLGVFGTDLAGDGEADE